MVEESTSTEEHDEEAIEWELGRVNFVEKVAAEVADMNFLGGDMLLALRFYLNKALLHFLHKEGLPKQEAATPLLTQAQTLYASLSRELDTQGSVLLRCAHLCDSIERFKEGLTASI